MRVSLDAARIQRIDNVFHRDMKGTHETSPPKVSVWKVIVGFPCEVADVIITIKS